MSIPFRPAQDRFLTLEEYEERKNATTAVQVARLCASGPYQRYLGARRLALSFRLLFNLMSILFVVTVVGRMKNGLAARNSIEFVPDVEAVEENALPVYGPFLQVYGPFLPVHGPFLPTEEQLGGEIEKNPNEITEAKIIREVYWFLLLVKFGSKVAVSIPSYRATKYVLKKLVGE